MSFPQPHDDTFVQVVLSTSQAYLLGVAADEAAGRKDISPQAKDNLERLSVFMYDVSTDPSRYPLTGKSAASLRSMFRQAKGAAQPPRNPNKRKRRQAERQGGHKTRRRNRQAAVAKFNAELDAAYEAELAASQSAQLTVDDALATANLEQPASESGTQVILP